MGFQKIRFYHVGKCFQEKNFSKLSCLFFKKKKIENRRVFSIKKIMINSLTMLEFHQKKKKKKVFFQNSYIKTFFQKIRFYQVGKCFQEKNFSKISFLLKKKKMKIREFFYIKKKSNNK